MLDYPLCFVWKNNPVRLTLYRRRCRVLARGTMNSVLIEFEDGRREIVSRNSVRMAKVERGLFDA